GACLLHCSRGRASWSHRRKCAVLERPDGTRAVVTGAADDFVMAVRVASWICGARSIPNRREREPEHLVLVRVVGLYWRGADEHTARTGTRGARRSGFAAQDRATDLALRATRARRGRDRE